MYEELVKTLRNMSKMGTKYGMAVVKMREAADAIEELEFACNRYEKDYKDLCDYLPKWIPVAERLPEKPEGYPKCEIRRTYYLVCLESGCVESLAYEFDRNEWQITGSPVVAWMQLPEPYKPPKEE